MVQAISASPGIINDLMIMADKVRKNELGVDEFVDGLIDVEAEKELAKVEAALETAADEGSEEEDEKSIQVRLVGCQRKTLKFLLKKYLSVSVQLKDHITN